MEFEKLGTRYSGLLAKKYDRNRARDAQWIFEDRAVDGFLSAVPQGAGVLDVPVGTGRFIALYKKYGLKATGIDASADMLAEAARKAEDIGYSCSLHVGDIRAIAAPDRGFDGVLCIRFLNWVDSEALMPVLAELNRVARSWLILGIRCSLSEPAPNAPKLTLWQQFQMRRRLARQKRKGRTRPPHDETMVLQAFRTYGLKTEAVARHDLRGDNTEYRIYFLRRDPQS